MKLKQPKFVNELSFVTHSRNTKFQAKFKTFFFELVAQSDAQDFVKKDNKKKKFKDYETKKPNSHRWSEKNV